MSPKAKRPPLDVLRDPDVFTISLVDAGKLLGIHRNTAYKAAESGFLCEGVPVMIVEGRNHSRHFIVTTENLRNVLGVTTGDMHKSHLPSIPYGLEKQNHQLQEIVYYYSEWIVDIFNWMDAQHLLLEALPPDLRLTATEAHKNGVRRWHLT
jgi:hypothetical protein